MGVSKSIANIKIQNLIHEFGAFKIQATINDKPRPVKKYHFCRSRPKVRKNPKTIGLGK